MKLQDAIAHADALRPNTVPEETKYRWLSGLDGRMATETMFCEPPTYESPKDAETELLIPAPYDDMYELYLCTMIDSANQESALYANDYELYNASAKNACAYWRRANRPPASGRFLVM